VKPGIHPDYMDCTVTCACGQTFATRSTKPEIRVEICSKCHPFFTGRQKIIDTEGRVERFIKRYGLEKKYASTRGTSEPETEAEE
jgi:large subunit ribosomal protein L31